MSATPSAPPLHVGSPQSLFRFNGIGTTLIGGFHHASLEPWYFKRFAFTILYIPLYVGRYYLVRGSRPHYQVAGWISGDEFKQRYGPRASNVFLLKSLAPLWIVAAVFAAMLVYAYQADEADLRARERASPSAVVTPS